VKNALRLNSFGAMLVRILFAAVAAFPIVFMLVSSLKPDQQIFGDMSSVAAFLPIGNISLDNYAAVFDRVPAARFLINSVGVSAVTVVLGIFINSLCAFALSRMQVRGKRIVFTAILATLIVPFQTLALPLVWWVNQLPYFELNGFSLEISKGWLDTYQVQIIPFIANAFSIYLYHQYFESIPKELDEAARIDGAGWFKIYRQVVMPLAGPATATVQITYGDRDLSVRITDTGWGPPLAPAPVGNGLIGMRERATAAGGRLDAGPAPDGGFQVTAQLPLETAP